MTIELTDAEANSLLDLLADVNSCSTEVKEQLFWNSNADDLTNAMAVRDRIGQIFNKRIQIALQRTQ